MEQEAERSKKMLARFLKNCESIVSQGVVSFMLHDVCMYREPVTRELHMQKLSIILNNRERHITSTESQSIQKLRIEPVSSSTCIRAVR